MQDFERVLDRDLCPQAPTLRLRYIRLDEGQLDDLILEEVDTFPPHEALELFPVKIDQLSLRSSAESAEF